MKKIILGVIFISMLVIACSTEIVDPIYRVQNQGASTVWVALGLYNGSTYTLKSSSWVEVLPGSYSIEIPIIEGVYYVLYDWDSDHSNIQTPMLERNYDPNTRYLLTFSALSTLSRAEY